MDGIIVVVAVHGHGNQFHAVRHGAGCEVTCFARIPPFSRNTIQGMEEMMFVITLMTFFFGYDAVCFRARNLTEEIVVQSIGHQERQIGAG